MHIMEGALAPRRDAATSSGTVSDGRSVDNDREVCTCPFRARAAMPHGPATVGFLLGACCRGPFADMPGFSLCAGADCTAAPSPTTTNGAHAEGWAFQGRALSLITASMARRNASARPTLAPVRISAKV